MSFERIVRSVVDCGGEAVRLQKDIDRNFKQDGSIITEADHAVDRMLSDTIRRTYPDAVLISEESRTGSAAEGPHLTFIIDPIDGTDAYSQGLPGWCVGVGILDETLAPVGAVIYAPRWGSFGEGETLLCLKPGKGVQCNGHDIEPRAGQEGKRGQIVISSGTHRKLDLSSFPGKIRTIGSALLHLVAPVLYPEIIAALQAPCYVWDIAAAHAVLSSCGFGLEYLSGGGPDYGSLVSRIKTSGFIIAGSNRSMGMVRQYIKPLPRQVEHQQERRRST